MAGLALVACTGRPTRRPSSTTPECAQDLSAWCDHEHQQPQSGFVFLAFLPQFVEPARGAMALQIMQLGAIFMVATLVTFGAIALLAGRFGQLLHNSPRAQVGLNRLASVVFAGLALRLLLAH